MKWMKGRAESEPWPRRLEGSTRRLEGSTHRLEGSTHLTGSFLGVTHTPDLSSSPAPISRWSAELPNPATQDSHCSKTLLLTTECSQLLTEAVSSHISRISLFHVPTAGKVNLKRKVDPCWISSSSLWVASPAAARFQGLILLPLVTLIHSWLWKRRDKKRSNSKGMSNRPTPPMF